MIKYKFCINADCRLACRAESEAKAWQWLARTKSLPVEEVQKLYYIKIEGNEKGTNDNS